MVLLFLYCIIHFHLILLFIIYQRIHTGKTMDGVCKTRSTYPSWAPEITPGFVGVRVAQSLIFYVVFCILLQVCCMSVNETTLHPSHSV